MNNLNYIDKAADDVISCFSSGSKRCCIISATGTGKSYMIKGTIDRLNPSKILILSARNSLLEQFKEKYDFGSNNIIYYKYTDIVRKFKNNDIDDLYNIDFIVCDEAHLVGAKNTSIYFEETVKRNPGVQILGATATPKRSDDITDYTVVDKFFEGNKIAEISLKEAIISGILPMPTYVASLYTLNEELEDRLLRVREDNSLSPEIKAYLMESLDEIKVNWESMNSLGQTFIRFIKPIADKKNSCKILVFCENQAHLKSVRKNLDNRFKNILYPLKVELNEYTSKNKNNEAFERFIDEKTEDGVCQILYVIDCFNLGQHVNNLDCSIMLRKTQSEIVYLQQVGRVLGVNGNKNPLIIDLVNNCKNVSNYKIWKDLQSYFDENPYNFDEKYNLENREKETHEVYFYNYIQDVEEIFSQIELNLNEKMYEYNKEFKTLVNWCIQYEKDPFDVKAKLSQGMYFKDALELSEKKDDLILQYNGFSGTLREICKKFHKNYALIRYRINNGSTLENAMM